MSSRVELKQKAKKIVSENFSNIFITNLILFLIFVLTGTIDGKLFSYPTQFTINGYTKTVESHYSVITTIVLCLVGFGIQSFYLKLARGEKTSWKEIFSKSNLIISYFLISIVSSIFIGLWTLLFIIPGIIAAIKYSMAYYAYLDDPTLKTMGSINKSKEIMKNHKMDYFVLGLSFIGWFILGIFTVGILYIWLIPYISVTYALFYDEISGHSNITQGLNNNQPNQNVSAQGYNFDPQTGRPLNNSNSNQGYNFDPQTGRPLNNFNNNQNYQQPLNNNQQNNVQSMNNNSINQNYQQPVNNNQISQNNTQQNNIQSINNQPSDLSQLYGNNSNPSTNDTIDTL